MNRIFKPSHLKRKLFFILSDISIIFLSVILAFNFRFDFEIESHYLMGLYISILFLTSIRFIGFYFFKIYDISWRHFSINDLLRLIYILIFSSLLLVLFTYFARGFEIVIPRSVIPMEFFISLFLIFALRISKRVYLESFLENSAYIPTVIIANADKAMMIIKSLHQTKEKYKPLAIIDNIYTGMKVNNIHVYSLEDLPALNIKFEAAILDISIDIQKVYNMLNKLAIKDIKIASTYSDYKTDLKEVSVEDLLARHPKDLDQKLIENFISNKKVLITGAGGSIGSQIARQCALFGAKKLILLDHSEFNLYSIAEELGSFEPNLVMQSVVNLELLEQTFEKYKPDIVIHAAAYKHVPLVEENITEAIINNVIGTKNTIDCAIKHNVQKFVLISTDKAVRPTNVMGTTKRICELYAQNVEAKNTEVVAVRFGNVLGSSGSVIPKFKAQIEAGKNITVTHPDITRYFMLIPEACELVLQAASIGKGGEIFILDMGEPIKIVDLASKMIELSGREDISIEFSGLRAGEKLYEELLINESDMKTEYESITVAGRTIYDIEKLNRDIQELVEIKDKLDKLKKIVPEFNHKVN
ncbi:MAG: nucleoside-diphosphate sugar epimerase/dehydratase [Arcobacteraceae bacterium]|nr:nucleoside-diphosphate sugar epimerase/dehydratase [Arcobacteraceae bacterium]